MDDHLSSRFLSRLASLSSLLAIVGLLFGVPLALVVYVGWPLPHEVPTWDSVRGAFQREGVPVEVLIKVLAVVVWVAWAQLAWALVAESVALFQGRTARPARVWPGAQLMARRLVASAALVVSSFGSVRTASAAPLAPLQEVEEVADPALYTTSAPPDLGPGSHPGVQAVPSVGVADRVAPAPTEQVYEVQRGDTFWGLAERFMGSGMRWREIRDRNVGRAVAPGRVLTMGEDHLDAGWRILIPSSTSTLPTGEPLTAPPSAAPPGTILSTLPEEPIEEPIEEPAEDPIDKPAEPAGTDEDELAIQPVVEVEPVVATMIDPVGEQMRGPEQQPLPSTLVVAPGDHFWSLAERQLEMAWGRQVSAEEVAPYWRDLVDANRSRISSGDPDLIFPGEQMTAPSPPPAPEAPAVPPDVAEPPPAPPPAPPSSEEEAEDVVPGAPTTTEAPTTSEAPTTTESPATTEAPVTTDAPPATTAVPAPDEVEEDQAEEVADEDDDSVLPLMLLAGSAAFAGLVLAALRRRRLSRRRLALPDDDIEARPLEDIRTERAYAIQAADVPDIVATVSRALGAVVVANPDLPPVTAVVVAPIRTVAVYFAEPCLPVAPFVAGPPSDRWDLYLDDLGDDPGFEHASPVLDTLTALGRTEADEWVFVDIESLGAVELTGDAVVAAELAQSMVAELSLQPAGEPMVDLTVIGMDRLSSVVADQGVVTVDHLDQDLVHRFERTAESTGAFLDRQGLRSTAAARAQGVERDGLFVTVVAFGGAEPADPVLLERLALAASPGGRGVAVVSVGPLGPGATRLVVTEDGRAHIPRLGITVIASRLAREDLDRVAELLEGEPERPTPGPPREAVYTPEDLGPYEEPPWRFCVRVFADHLVETRDGDMVSFRYGDNPDVPNKNTLRGPELLAYLALSGRAASATDVRDHLWWDRPVALATVNKLLYGTRKVLGGAELLSLAQDDPVGRYRLSPEVVTDAELLSHALEHAHAVSASDPDLAADLLRRHLSGIEAVAFRSGALGQGLAEWAAAYRVIDRVEQPVIDAALLMAKLCTSRGPEAYGEALWAVDQGLNACPVNEALVRAAMELEAVMGSPEAANGRYQTLATKLARDELEPEDETSDLRARLRRSGGRISD
jgi:nucleoid-associated protein YgaU/DNA-binding SARP family transcriptional activator